MAVQHDEVLLLESSIVSNPDTKQSSTNEDSAEPTQAGEIIAMDISTSGKQAASTGDGQGRMISHAEVNMNSQFAPDGGGALTRIAQEFPSSTADPLPFTNEHQRVEFPEGEEPFIPETGSVNLHLLAESQDTGAGTETDAKVYLYVRHGSGGL